MNQKIAPLTGLICALSLFTPHYCSAKNAPHEPTASATINQSIAATEILFGNWSRSTATCKRPELTFSKNSMTIRIDADGEPIQFTYNPVNYEHLGQTITAKLGKQHPYGHTRSKEAISFNIANNNSISIETTKFEPIKFIRCKKGSPT